MSNLSYDDTLKSWISLEKKTVDFIQIISTLWFEKSVEIVLFRNVILNKNISEVLNFHQYAAEVSGLSIDIHLTLQLAQGLEQLDLAPARIDIGRLAENYMKSEHTDVNAFLKEALNDFLGTDKHQLQPKDVVLYGFGRIGRLAARELIAQTGKGEQLRLRAIVTRGNSDNEIKKRASLLRMDSVHGVFPGTITEDLENKCLIINGQIVQMIATKNPEDVDYEAYGIHNALLIDNTGAARDREGLSKHLQAKGVSKVLLTAPGKGDIPNVVHGVNQAQFDVNTETIFSAASCTTNAIVPILSALKRHFEIQSGHIETIHSYTNDQNLLDNYHKNERRGRSAPLNMVLTETGAAKAVVKIFPEFVGKLTANAVRVPTPNVSLAILKLNLDRATTKDELNAFMKDAALKGDLVEQIQYAFSTELVSSDIVGNPCATVFDSNATLVSDDGKHVVIYTWYDNEYGYTRQVIRYAKWIAQVRRLMYY